MKRNACMGKKLLLHMCFFPLFGKDRHQNHNNIEDSDSDLVFVQKTS